MSCSSTGLQAPGPERPGGLYKAVKRARHPWLLVMAETLKHPQEVWEQWEWVGARERMGAKAAMTLRRRYLAWRDKGKARRPAGAIGI